MSNKSLATHHRIDNYLFQDASKHKFIVAYYREGLTRKQQRRINKKRCSKFKCKPLPFRA
jgi:hypothetical protein